MPSKAGWYWARTKDENYYNVLVYVSGVAPFFRATGVDPFYFNQRTVDVADICWGPALERPEAIVGV